MTATRAGAVCAKSGADSAAAAIEMRNFFMTSPLCCRGLGQTVIMRRLVRIPDCELETGELVAGLSRRIDRVDEANGELEDRKKNPQLAARRVAQFREIDFVGVPVGV